MENIYYLNLATLLKTLATVSAVLTAELPDGVPGYTQPCKGFVRVHNNSISMCAVVSNGQVIAEGKQALQLLENHKAWYISFPPDLLDNGAHRPASPAPSPRRSIPPSRPLTQDSSRYPSIPVEYVPATEPLFQQMSPLRNTNSLPTTGPLPSRDSFFARGEPSSYRSTQPGMPAVNAGLVVGSRVFQARMALTPGLMGKYNSKERLILRTVYSKINGQRSVDQLKEELRLPATMIEQALLELYRLGIIA